MRVNSLVDAVSTKVDGKHHFCADQLGPGEILINTNLFGDDLRTGSVQNRLTLFDWAYAVLPAPAGDKVATETDCGQAGFFQTVDEVMTEASLVSGGMIRAIHGAVDYIANEAQ